MHTNFNNYINESNGGKLTVYRDDTKAPYNYMVKKGDEMYRVSFRRGKPFLFKYDGKTKSSYSQPGLVSNPSKAFISLIQAKLVNPNKPVNEEFTPVGDLAGADKISFMNKLKLKLDDLIKGYSTKFNIDYNIGRSIIISTDNPGDLSINISVDSEKLYYDAKPTSGPNFNFEYSFNEDNINSVVKTVEQTLEDDPNKGILPEPKGKIYKYDTKDQGSKITLDDVDPLEKPITKRPTKRSKSININIIQNVLEDAYIIDDIDLKDTTVKELIRRMLLESRK